MDLSCPDNPHQGAAAAVTAQVWPARPSDVRPSTLKDVANLAKVSPKTVSNVINGYATVSDTIRRRVQTAAAELDYRPNPVARALRNGERTSLTLIVPQACTTEMTDLVSTFIKTAQDSGLILVTDNAFPISDQAHLLVLGLPAT